jgi:hypothetical protein
MVTKEMRIITILFISLGIAEQLSNGLLKTTFVITDLLSIYGIVAAYYGINFGIASKWNQGGYPTQPQGPSSIKAPVNTQQLGGKN